MYSFHCIAHREANFSHDLAACRQPRQYCTTASIFHTSNGGEYIGESKPNGILQTVKFTVTQFLVKKEAQHSVPSPEGLTDVP